MAQSRHSPIVEFPNLFELATGFAAADNDRAKRLSHLSTDLLLSGMREGRYDDLPRRWFVHLLLHRHRAPPCLRFAPYKQGSADQLTRYEMWCADILWIRSVSPGFTPLFEKPANLFNPKLDAAAWHRFARHCAEFYRLDKKQPFDFVRTIFGLGQLPKKTLRELAFLLPDSTRKERKRLFEMERLRAEIQRKATEKPDRSGRFDALKIVYPRLNAWRLKVLSQSDTVAARYYKMETGQTVSRQWIQKKCEAAEIAYDDLLARERAIRRTTKQRGTPPV